MLLLRIMFGIVAGSIAGGGMAATIEHERMSDGSELIFITGEIKKGDDATFRDLTIKFPNAIVALESNGGALLPALEIGRLIRLRGYTTFVTDDSVCVSSCALIWIAGPRRVLSETGAVGFHASYLDEGGVKVEKGAANALVGHYLSQLNLPEKAVVFATLAAPTQVAWLDASNKLSAGIDFETYVPELEEASVVAEVEAPPSIQTMPVADTAAKLDTAGALRALFRQPGFADSAARSVGADAKLVGSMSEHLRLLYANDALVDRVAYEIDAARVDYRKNPQLAGSVLYRLSTSLTYKGLKRLPQGDLNKFFFYLSEVSKRQDSKCEIFKDTGRVNISEFVAIHQLGDGSLNEYLSLLRKAIFAEVENSIPVISLDESQTKLAENAWAESLADEIGERSQADIDRLLPAIENFEGADPPTQCELRKIMVPAASEMKGIVGDWFRRLYVGYVTDGM